MVLELQLTNRCQFCAACTLLTVATEKDVPSVKLLAAAHRCCDRL